ncbi:hypothetical protein D8B26_007260 [Coccidioides posadasii str. Silveira]|uniref:uncharacterized protein n=1 Tax=Coccidioides posadasii (strain RMSCC 757 / Silveira) TaxID=443226 RepID=UPI001BF05673|nr:hypothetical protein D8B26_007260 [Coccidioides posadasii str. Silveira]
MATPRLPFLYPNLLRSVRSCEPTTHRSIRFPPAQRSVGFHSGPACEQQTYQQRYGPAAEPHLRPPPWSTGKGDILPPDNSATKGEKQVNGSAQAQGSKGSSKQPGSSVPGTIASSLPSSSSSSSSSDAVSVSSNVLSSELPTQGKVDGDAGPADSEATAEASAQKDTDHDPDVDSLGSVFQMPDAASMASSSSSSSSPPAESTSLTHSPGSESNRPPHLSPPPYVHHFDTYSLVKDLGNGGFTDKQSVIIMKAIRGILADNLEVARNGLMSKSDFENETYLFRAACSELRNSIQTSRNAEIQAQRAQRAQLQHEVDILTQKMTQELSGLNDSLKEMFNDQKISTKELQRSQDTGIQELNYQITVSLNSDGKRVVESLRWILTRRAAVAIATSASMIILALRLHSYKQQKNEKEKAAAAAAPPPPSAEASFPNEIHSSTSLGSNVAESMG